MTDSRGETAYLMADISNVKETEIATLYKDLEGLKGTSRFNKEPGAHLLTLCRENHHADIVLSVKSCGKTKNGECLQSRDMTFSISCGVYDRAQ